MIQDEIDSSRLLILKYPFQEQFYKLLVREKFENNDTEMSY